MIKLPNTLSFRLTLWYASAFLMCLVIALIILYLSLNTILKGRMDDDLREDIKEFHELFVEEGLDEVFREIEREANSSDESEIFLRVRDHQGTVILSSDMKAWKGLDSSSIFSPARVFAQSDSLLETVALPEKDYPARAIIGQIGPGISLQIGETLEKNEEIMGVLLMVFAGLLVLGIPVASGVGWFIARRAVRGVEEVSRAARAIEHGDLDRRVSVSAQGDEIQTLADTFNAMATRIKNLIHEMREMTDNIAHDLRSPLARIRAMSEGVLTESHMAIDYKRAAVDTLKECDRLMHLINTTLDMAEVDAGVTTTVPEAIDLAKLITDLFELYEPVSGEKHIALSAELEPNCTLTGHKHNLQRMVANLLDNALKYTPADGQIRIKLIRSPREYRLTIEDTGVGIPLPDQPRVFDRFFRCDHSRTQEGCGLGLSFARSVARAYGGDITLKSETATGSIFTATFPLPSSLQ